jgi:TIR domain
MYSPPVSAPGLEVFLSHATADREHVQLVSAQIEALGVKVWLAEHDPMPGTLIQRKVHDALKRCAAVVVLITNSSVDSAYVQQEIGAAVSLGKPVIPIIDKSLDRFLFQPGMLAGLEWLTLDLDSPADAMAKVTATLQPLVISQLVVDVSVNVTPTPAQTLLLLGVGLLLGYLIFGNRT